MLYEVITYRGCQFVGETENFVAVANDVAIVIWDKKNDEYTKFSKANGLSDIGISALTGLSDDQFIIGYKNGNIDIIKDGKVSNLPEIMNKGDFGSKAINHFYVHDNLIYLSLNFGIQVLDMILFLCPMVLKCHLQKCLSRKKIKLVIVVELHKS